MMRLSCATALALLVIEACGKVDPRPGDVCGGAEADEALCRDPDHVLACSSYTWHLDACRGPGGCATDGPGVAHCDQTLRTLGDACNDITERACSVGRTELLKCDGAQMVAAQRCRGRRGCYRDAAGGPATCDQGGAEAGDPCEGEGSHCAADGKSVLTCAASHRYVTELACRGAKGCRRIAGEGSAYLVCDVSVGDVGESCALGDGSRPTRVCSTDARQVNGCMSGRFAQQEACIGGCVVRWGEDGRTYEAACEGAPD